MKVILNKKPKNPILIEGFPGFGLVGTIATEFLLEHLEMERIGKIEFDEMPAMVAIHDGKTVEPLGIFYNKKFNIVILHAITPSNKIEWEIAAAINKLAKDLSVKEIISLEGVGSGEDSGKESKVFYFSNNDKKSKAFEKIKIPKLNEGIIIGVTGAVMLRADAAPVSCLFAETHSRLPDSKAAAKIIEVIDKYLGIKVDVKPLLVQAQKFEAKLKTMMQQGQQAKDLSDKKKMSYVG